MKIIIVAMLVLATTLGATAQSKKQKGKMLRHVVLVKFKDSSTPEDVRRVEEAFAGLKKKISQIKQFEWGKNNSPENLNQGHTHCFLATFANEKDRDDYLVHPIHKEFVSIAGPHLDKVTVVDYWLE